MYRFSALVLRMKYVNRWGLMRSSKSESLAEHAAETAVVANILAAVAKRIYKQDVRPDAVAAAALYHDCSEIMTGDMPTPSKYRIKALTEQYKKLENESLRDMLEMLPEELREELAPTVCGAALNERERRILKAADKLSALIKCVEEERFGNTEFASAMRTTRALIDDMRLPEADYFITHFLPAHYLDLDQLLK